MFVRHRVRMSMSKSSLRQGDTSVCRILDRSGSVASLACAIHCALMPFLFAFLPAALGATLSSDWIEWGLFGCSAFIGMTSMHVGKKLHRKRIAFAVCAIGVTMLGLGRIGEERHWGWIGVPVLVLGGMVVASSHFVNMHLCRRCSICEDIRCD